MSVNTTDLIGQLGAVQEAIWQKVSVTVSEAAGQAITFANPLTLQADPNELIAELAAPMLAVQFAFGSILESQQVLLISPETFAAFASLAKQEVVEKADENLVADVRPSLEALVQGICLSIGESRGEPVVATGLTCKYQSFAFPPNMAEATELVRTQVALTGEDLNGTVIWLMDLESAAHVLSVDLLEETESPFQQIEGGASAHPMIPDATGGLDIVRDIPLEISVELGRVTMLVKEVLELGTGSIVEIDKAAGEPVDVLVNGLRVAKGEVVVIADNFGVRITEVLNPHDRMNLGEVA